MTPDTWWTGVGLAIFGTVISFGSLYTIALNQEGDKPLSMMKRVSYAILLIFVVPVTFVFWLVVVAHAQLVIR